jgi:polyisoprenoid-binding protein YceI
MKKQSTLTAAAIAAALMMTAGSSMADWVLDAADSRLNFNFVKKQHIVETGSFGVLSGSVTAAGEARLEVSLGTVNTLVAIRDQRMQEFLFETSSHPTAVYSAHIDPGKLIAVLEASSGTQQVTTLNGHLELHGVKHPLNTDVIVTKTGPNSLSVDSARPVIIRSDDYQLTAGIDKLQELAKLSHIAHAVPVNFHLVYRAK